MLRLTIGRFASVRVARLLVTIPFDTAFAQRLILSKPRNTSGLKNRGPASGNRAVLATISLFKAVLKAITADCTSIHGQMLRKRIPPAVTQSRSANSLAIFVMVITALVLHSNAAQGAEIAAVQSGSATIANLASSTTATLSPSVDLTRSILWFSVTNSGNTVRDVAVSGQITNPTTITFARISTSGAIDIKWYVAEFSSGVSVQRGVITKTGNLCINQAISVVDLTNTFVLVSDRRAGGSWNNNDFVRARFTSTTNLEFCTVNVQAGTDTEIVEWQVISFTTGASVQSGLASFLSTDASITAALSPAVDTTRSFLIFNYRSESQSNADIGEKMVRGRITTPTQVTFDRDNTGQTIDVSWFVVEFSDGTTVQSGSTGFLTTDGQRNETITAVDLNRSVAFSSNGMASWGQSAGKTPFNTDDQPGNALFRLNLTSGTNLQITRAVTGATADVGWFVVEFALAPLSLTKTAFWTDGTPIPTGATIPSGVEFKYLLYINNPDIARSDVSVRDVLDPAFQYQAATIQVDNSVAECAVAVCTAAEEQAIFTAVDGAAFLSDAIDADTVSFNGGNTVDAGNQNVANGQLNINADAVWAILFSVRML